MIGVSLSDVAEPVTNRCIFNSFPSMMPIGLRDYMIPYIHQNHEAFWKTYKINGLRVLIHFDSSTREVYLIDRRLRTFLVHTEPSSSVDGDVTLDGELVYIPVNNRYIFFAFDVLTYDSQPTNGMSMQQRHDLMLGMSLSKIGTIDVYVKRFFPLYYNASFSPVVPLSFLGHVHDKHANMTDDPIFSVDGLILMDVRGGYDVNDTEIQPEFRLLKWKPTPTVDVLMYTSDLHKNHIVTYYWEFNHVTRYKEMRAFMECVLYDDTIRNQISTNMSQRMTCVECEYDRTGDQWYIVGVRLDKTRSNAAQTITETIEIIREHVQEDMFVTIPGKPDYSSSGICWMVHAWDRRNTYELECRLYYNHHPIEPNVFYRILANCHLMIDCFEITHSTDYYYNKNVRKTVVDTSSCFIRKHKHATKQYQLSSNWSMQMVLSSEIPVPELERYEISNYETSYMHRKKHRTRFIHKRFGVYIDFTIVTDQNNNHSFEIEIEYYHRAISNGHLHQNDLIQLIHRILQTFDE